MLVYIQWATRTVRDWGNIDLWSGAPAAWTSQPKKGVPPTNPTIDNQAGWVNAINVQGMTFAGYDHYRLELAPAGDPGIIVTVWTDDPRSSAPDDFQARVLHFRPLAPDPTLPGNPLNTRITQTIYAAPNVLAALNAIGPLENTTVRPWSEWVSPPDDAATRHGVLLDNARFDALMNAQTRHPWDEWAGASGRA